MAVVVMVGRVGGDLTGRKREVGSLYEVVGREGLAVRDVGCSQRTRAGNLKPFNMSPSMPPREPRTDAQGRPKLSKPLDPGNPGNAVTRPVQMRRWDNTPSKG